MFFIVLKVWDGLSGEEELSLQHKHIVKSVFFSNDSAALATARYNFSVLSTSMIPPPPLHAIVSDPDPGSNWIRILSGTWIRIRIQEALKCWMFSSDGCRLLL
jgi:hypothetical protein